MPRPDPASENPTPPLLEALGEEVRSGRQGRSWSIRELSERSGLSARFLTDLELGRANVSVARLSDLSRSLGVSAGQLLIASEARAARKRSASHTGLVALVGLRGAGKTTIGCHAAESLGVPFIELDRRVETTAGMAIAEIFDLHGQTTFRRLEREALEEILSQTKDAVIATGGSLVTEHATYDRLLAACRVVWLKANPEDHFARVLAQGDERPMRHRENAMDELRSLLRARSALYDRAELCLDTSKLGESESAKRLVRFANGSRRRTIPA